MSTGIIIPTLLLRNYGTLSKFVNVLKPHFSVSTWGQQHLTYTAKKIKEDNA